MTMLALFLLGALSQTQSKTAGIQGTVIETGTSAPIARVLVVLRNSEKTNMAVGTYSNVTGQFSFQAVEPGKYYLSVERSGFLVDSKERLPMVTVETPGGEAPAPLTLKMTKCGVVTGRVLDASGEPITGAAVQVLPAKPQKNGEPRAGFGSTDDRGYYRVFNLAPGRYKISVTYAHMNAMNVTMQHEEAAGGGAAAEFSYGTTYYPGTLDAAQAVPVQVGPGAEVPGIDVRLQRTGTFHVRGTAVMSDGEAGTPIMVLLMPMSAGGQGQNQTQAAPDGSFELRGVLPGKYILAGMTMVGRPGSLGSAQENAKQIVEVGAGDVEGVQLVLGRLQEVTGSVLMPAGRKVPKGMMVFLQSRQDDSSVGIYGGGGSAEVADNGTFRMENVQPGDYDANLGTTADKGDDLYASGIQAGGQDVMMSGLHVGGGAGITSLEIALKANGAQVECSVMDDKQKPVAQSLVMLLPDAPRTAVLVLQGMCVTDAKGVCTVAGLAPGDYHLYAQAKDAQIDWRNAEAMGRIQKVWKGMSVKEGDQKKVQLDLVQGDAEAQ